MNEIHCPECNKRIAPPESITLIKCSCGSFVRIIKSDIGLVQKVDPDKLTVGESFYEVQKEKETGKTGKLTEAHLYAGLILIGVGILSKILSTKSKHSRRHKPSNNDNSNQSDQDENKNIPKLLE